MALDEIYLWSRCMHLCWCDCILCAQSWIDHSPPFIIPLLVCGCCLLHFKICYFPTLSLISNPITLPPMFPFLCIYLLIILFHSTFHMSIYMHISMFVVFQSIFVSGIVQLILFLFKFFIQLQFLRSLHIAVCIYSISLTRN